MQLELAVGAAALVAHLRATASAQQLHATASHALRGRGAHSFLVLLRVVPATLDNVARDFGRLGVGLRFAWAKRHNSAVKYAREGV
jgi:hypothetical protein